MTVKYAFACLRDNALFTGLTVACRKLILIFLGDNRYHHLPPLKRPLFTQKEDLGTSDHVSTFLKFTHIHKKDGR